MTSHRLTGVDADTLALHLVLDGADADRKLAALGAMASQTRDAIAMIGPELYAADVAEEAFVEVGARAARQARRGDERGDHA